ncbi:MAG: hypothetical protein ACXVXP_11945 [Mycobacteriaceae bacterium]
MANPVQINDGLFTDGSVVSAQDARTSLASLVAHDGAGARLGVFYEGTQTLITGTATTSPSMQVAVAPLAFCGQKASAEGVYIGRSPGTVLVDIAAAPASNSRIDTVYVMQRDHLSNTSADAISQGEVGVITGTASATPTAPAAPAGAVVVGTVQVAAGVTATTNAGCTIATTCTWTTGAGSPIPVRTQAERDALTAFGGLRVLRLDLAGDPVGTYDAKNSTWWGTSFQSIAPTGVNFTNPPAGYGTLTLGVSGKMANLTGNVSWVNGSSGITVATIPAPYAPAYEVAFTSVSQNNNTGVLGTTYRGVVTTAGVIALNWMGTTRDPNNVIPIQATWLIA